ncbi:hypothetical protein Pla22_30610 [Rubripirellula amarantea]|uniref:DUF1501 domain-containing protein n=1 Tax=Rubripirellula amarantea TaxID=2527999 RepID=A0A5C5WJJ8_9BACT|nr:DUF1501 domain-containing protein [Rubripirellula amarantea]TWT50319.1 hypothetical protein Pla22_30610 [Rubripirellula amarantea]
MNIPNTNFENLPGASRRQFLKRLGGCGLMTNASLMSTMLSLGECGVAAAQQNPSDYKALVCLFLYGGNDSFNMLTPLTPGEYENYVTVRGGLYDSPSLGVALPESLLHPIVDASSSRSFGVHPEMPEIQSIYNDGNAAFISNVGSLVRPTTIADFNADVSLPLGLFSHLDLQRHWMSSIPQSRLQVSGWMGRMADWTSSMAAPSNFSMNISLDRTNLMQTGRDLVPYVISPDGSTEVLAYGDLSDPLNAIMTGATDDMLTRSHANRFKQLFSNNASEALTLASQFNSAIAATPDLEAYFPTERASSLQQKLKIVARTIAAQQTLGHGRQTFFIGVGGFDNHQELIAAQGLNLGMVSKAIADFFAAVQSLGKGSEVVTFTASDFGRTLSSNGRGTDHGWGGNQLVVSEAVVGNRILGDYPVNLLNSPDLDVGRGRLLPTTSVDEMASELAMWFGVPNDSQLELILPNAREFVSTGNDRPVGFLS